MTCLHYDNDRDRCNLGLYGGKPSPGVCFRCEHWDGPMRGAGDVVAKLTTSVGVKPCGKCKRRQGWSNKIFPRKSAKDSRQG